MIIEGFPEHVGEITRRESGRVIATLCRLTGSLDRAEDAFSDAVTEALLRWPASGIPERPGAWLTTVAKRKALDLLRRESRRAGLEESSIVLTESEPPGFNTIRDDQLRLIFTCCHPALSLDSRVALSLRVLGGLTTAEIASAFLVPEATMGKRITRAKAKIETNRIPYRIPPDEELPARLSAVLAVVALIFTTGHHAPSGTAITRVELTAEAQRLAMLLVDLMPDEPECLGLLALLESTAARRSTRLDDNGDIVLLADADRSLWDRPAIDHAVETVQRALRRGRPGVYQLQAAISCLHSVATSIETTDWAQIAALYAVLENSTPSVPVRVNRAVAVGQHEGPEAGLVLLDGVGGADDWHLFHLARGDLLERAGDHHGAAAAFDRALSCAMSEPDRRLVTQRRRKISGDLEHSSQPLSADVIAAC